MSHIADAEASLRAGDPEAALQKLQNAVREKPSDAKLRIFLFQLLSVQGSWERALNQLNVSAELDASALAMAQMYREALKCELLRAEVFAGRKSPVIFGQPEQWLALLIESLLQAGHGNAEHAAALREQAFELAPTTSGSINDQPFSWIADADMRLGPVCEAVINGRYYWLPYSNLVQIDIEEPEDLRDQVWCPAHFVFSNGGESIGVIPTRYPGSETSDDGLIRLARKTDWVEAAGGIFTGLGQRVLTTDAGEFALLDVRTIKLDEVAGEAGEAGGEE
ncbi:type VI secretion system accessory protein TagJ [Viridibacterium curvum]|uniref:Type VI secretion system accessory protein TagJ n=1 Tax=Viridibacterium curvum TaxID=1101404 RepID=A0ABP9QU55_9RHOO